MIYFGCVNMRTTRPRWPKPKGATQEHDFSGDKDHCAKCGMRYRVWEDTHASCPAKQVRFSANNNRPLTS
jgi:hypothetical protein